MTWVVFGPGGGKQGSEAGRTQPMSMARVAGTVKRKEEEWRPPKNWKFIYRDPKRKRREHQPGEAGLGRRAGQFGQKCLIGVFEIDYILGKHTGGAYTSRRKKDLIYI